jgi:5'-nucleotidase
VSFTRLATLAIVVLGAAAISRVRGPIAADRVSSGASVTISVIATTDLHGGVLQRGERGGLALFGGYLRNLRAARLRDGGGVLLVDSGDMFQGTLESNLNEGAAVVRAYNRLGYAAAAIGNHEFDYGPVGPQATPTTPSDDPRGALKARAAEARFPLLTANVIDESTGQPVAWPNVRPSTMVTVAGVKVGIVGVTTTSTPVTTIAENLRGLTFAPLAPAIEREASQLRASGASAVVVVAHAGGRCRTFDTPADISSCDAMSEIMSVARALPPGLVDVIAAGHTHQGMANQVNGIAVVEGYSAGRTFSRVDLTVSRARGTIVGLQIFPPTDLCAREDPTTRACDGSAPAAQLVAAHYEGRPVVADPAIADVLDPAVRAAGAVKNESLGVVLDTDLPRSAQTESALGNLLADEILAATPHADVSIVNGGAIRTSLPAGTLTYGQLYELYPFDNRLVTLTLTGDQMSRIVAFNLQRREPPLEILSTAGVQAAASCESDGLRVALRRGDGSLIAKDDRLTVVTNDFVASGGDGVLSPVGSLGPTRSEGLPLLRDAVADGLRRRGGHVREDQLYVPGSPRWSYPGSRPVSCGR